VRVNDDGPALAASVPSLPGDEAWLPMQLTEMAPAPDADASNIVATTMALDDHDCVGVSTCA